MAKHGRDPADPLIQMNVRIPKSLRAQVDARREEVGLSRDRWVTNALTWILQQTVIPGAPYRSGQGVRTAPPPTRRPRPPSP